LNKKKGFYTSKEIIFCKISEFYSITGSENDPFPGKIWYDEKQVILE